MGSAPTNSTNSPSKCNVRKFVTSEQIHLLLRKFIPAASVTLPTYKIETSDVSSEEKETMEVLEDGS